MDSDLEYRATFVWTLLDWCGLYGCTVWRFFKNYFIVFHRKNGIGRTWGCVEYDRGFIFGWRLTVTDLCQRSRAWSGALCAGSVGWPRALVGCAFVAAPWVLPLAQNTSIFTLKTLAVVQMPTATHETRVQVRMTVLQVCCSVTTACLG